MPGAPGSDRYAQPGRRGHPLRHARSGRAARALAVAAALAFVAPGDGWAAEEAAGPEGGFRAEELLPFSPRRARFRLQPSEGEPREVAWSRLPSADQEGAWRVEVAGVQAALLVRDEAGAIRIRTHWDYTKGQRIDYEPPALLLPPRLAPGAEGRSESDVVVHDLDSGRKRASGTCVHRARWVGEQAVETPAGRFRAVRIDLTREVDVPIADARVTIELAFVPGRGRVLERTVERVRFFGVGGGRERRVLELVAEQDPPEDGSPP